MKLKLISWDGNNINDGTNFDAADQTGNWLTTAEASYTPVNNSYDRYAGIAYGHKTMFIGIAIIGTFHTLKEQLKQWFEKDRHTLKKLVAYDVLNGNKPWYMYAVCKDLIEEGHIVTVVLELEEPFWRADDLSTDAWSITASAQTRNITVGGNKFAPPKYKIKPTSGRTGGYAWKRYVAICNRLSAPYLRFYNFTDGNWNTTTPISGGKMQADGDDLRIFNDVSGQEVFRWFGGGGINSSTTRPFVNVALRPKIEFTLNGSLSNVGSITTISVKNTAANIAALTALKQEGYKVLVIDMGSGTQEIFTFTDVSVSGLQITGVTPAAKGCSRQNHADGATIRHVSGAFWVMYGDSSLSAPSTDDAFKPMIDMANSTNGSEVFTDFYDPLNPARIGQWIPHELANVGGESEFYTATGYAYSSGPASVMGMVGKVYYVGLAPRQPSFTLGWIFNHPCGITTVSASGQKRRQGVTFPAVAGLRVPQRVAVTTIIPPKKKGGTATKKVTYVTKLISIWNDASPAAAGAWESLAAHSAVALGATYPEIGFYFNGSIGANDDYAAIEYDNVTVVPDSSTLPLCWFGSELVNNYADFKLTNNTTNQWVSVRTLCAVNDTVIVDTELMKCYLESDPSTGIPITLDDESRAEWLALDPTLNSGVNQLKYEETGVNALTLTTEWRARAL